MEEEKQYPSGNYSKSNFLIGAKYKSTLLENQITALSLYKIYRNEYKEDKGRMVCSIEASELRKLLHKNKGSFYSQLENTANNMASRTIGFSDPIKEEFVYISVIDRAEYIKGVFSVYFNADLKEYLLNLDKNFTILELPIMLKFKHGYSFRLYELLSSKLYLHKNTTKIENTYKINFNLSELKLEMGVVNANTDSVRRELNKSKTPDYDKAVAKAEEKNFNSWYEFKRSVIEVAKKEINEKTNLNIEYDTIRSGRGGKVCGINFYVTKKGVDEETIKENKKKLDMTDIEKFIFYSNVLKLFEEYNLTIDDIQPICVDADFNMEKIENAKKLLDNTSNVNNVIGWIKDCIKKGYKSAPTKSKQKFMERETDIDEMKELEKMLLNR